MLNDPAQGTVVVVVVVVVVAAVVVVSVAGAAVVGTGAAVAATVAAGSFVASTSAAAPELQPAIATSPRTRSHEGFASPHDGTSRELWRPPLRERGSKLCDAKAVANSRNCDENPCHPFQDRVTSHA